MLLRRIREQAALHNWFGVGVDLIILIAGVFLGIQASNWNQGRIDRVEGSAYRQRLVNEIESNRLDLANRLIYYKDVKAFAKATLAALDRPVGDDPQAFLVSAYQASQITPRRTRRFTYDEALSTGTAANLGAAGLRERIANYYTAVETREVTFLNVTPYRENIRSAMPAAAQEAVRSQCPEAIPLAEDGLALTFLPHGCTMRMDQAEAARYAALVRTIPTLRPDLARAMADLDAKIRLVELLSDHARQIIQQIKAAD